jgi:hypothetical protein
MCLAVCVCAVHALSLINHACICWRSSLISRSTTSHTLTRQSWLPRVSYNPPHVGILLVHVKTTSFLSALQKTNPLAYFHSKAGSYTPGIH